MATSLGKFLIGVPISVLLTSLASACGGFGYGTLDACTGVAVGAKYQLELGAGLDGASGMCAAAWGFAEGNVFVATIVSTAGRETCDSGVATLSGDGGWSLGLKNDGLAGGGALLESDYTIQRASCSGSAEIGLGCDSSCLNGHAMPCACRLSVNMHGAGSCPASCSLVLAASVSRL